MSSLSVVHYCALLYCSHVESIPSLDMNLSGAVISCGHKHSRRFFSAAAVDFVPLSLPLSLSILFGFDLKCSQVHTKLLCYTNKSKYYSSLPSLTKTYIYLLFHTFCFTRSSPSRGDAGVGKQLINYAENSNSVKD